MNGIFSFLHVFLMLTLAALNAKVKALREFLSQYTEPGIVSRHPFTTAAYYYVNGTQLCRYHTEGGAEIFTCKDRILIIVKDWMMFMDKRNKVRLFSKKVLNKKWDNLVNRCLRPSSSSSRNYFDRGITVCKEWRGDSMSFMVWAVMFGGYFEGSVIDRINNDRGYEPDNVRFVTYLGSLNNKRNTLKIDVDGEEDTLTEWSRRTGISYQTLLKLYHSDTEALEDVLRNAVDD